MVRGWALSKLGNKLIVVDETIRKKSMEYVYKQILQFQNCSYKKRCSEYMQETYTRTSMPKCYFNKVAMQLY